MSKDKVNYIEISQADFVCKGSSRLVYLHPRDPKLLIKVVNPESKDEIIFSGKLLMRRSVRVFGGFRATAREYSQYIALMQRARKIPSFCPVFRGFVEANLGPGTVEDAILDESGQIELSLDNFRNNIKNMPEIQRALTAFFDLIEESGCVISDVGMSNLIYSKIEDKIYESMAWVTHHCLS